MLNSPGFGGRNFYQMGYSSKMLQNFLFPVNIHLQGFRRRKICIWAISDIIMSCISYLVLRIKWRWQVLWKFMPTTYDFSVVLLWDNFLISKSIFVYMTLASRVFFFWAKLFLAKTPPPKRDFLNSDKTMIKRLFFFFCYSSMVLVFSEIVYFTLKLRKTLY